jgi:hypothetical protein
MKEARTRKQRQESIKCVSLLFNFKECELNKCYLKMSAHPSLCLADRLKVGLFIEHSLHFLYLAMGQSY